MNRTYWRVALLIPWIVTAIGTVQFWQAWDRFPARMASHFNYYGQADGWVDKGAFPIVLIFMPVLLLSIFTVILTIAKKLSASVWVLFVLEYWLTAILFFVNRGLVQYNLGLVDRLYVPFLPATVIAVLAAAAGVAVFVSRLQRTVYAHGGGLLAEERHGSAWLAGVLLVLAVIPVSVGVFGPPPARIGMAIALAVLLFCAAFAWRGFEYRITTSGIEIRAFGFPLRFIPGGEIRQYGAEECNPFLRFGGYGIRGIGRCRAYIWGGRKVLHVRTEDSDVYLGHADPARMVRELDDMKQLTH